MSLLISLALLTLHDTTHAFVALFRAPVFALYVDVGIFDSHLNER